MITTLTRKGQVTIPKHIRDALALATGSRIEFALNAAGDIVLRAAHPPVRARAGARPRTDRFEAVRGKASVKWRTDELMKLLRD